MTKIIKNAALPGAPVLRLPTAAADLLIARGWTLDPGPATTPTFAPPAVHATTVLIKHPSLPGRTIVVPYLAFYGLTGVGGYQTMGWVLGP